MREDQAAAWQRQKKIVARIYRLNGLIKAGILEPVTDKRVLRNEIAVMTAGFPITKIPFGASTTLYAWSDRSTDLSGG